VLIGKLYKGDSLSGFYLQVLNLFSVSLSRVSGFTLNVNRSKGRS
jgi:hypothetical protein